MSRAENTPPSTNDVIQLLFDLAPHIRISEHVPGEIVLKFGLSGLGVLQDSDIGEIGRTIPGIRKARTSLWKRAVVIEYDEDQVPFDIWAELAASGHDPVRQKALRRRLRGIIENPAG